MLDVDLESIRRDIHAYTLGLLWLLALIAALVSPGDIHRIAIFLDSLAQQMGHVAVPPYVAGFLMALIGVILPYCMFQAFEPLTQAIMHLCLGLVRKLRTVKPSDSLNKSALSAMTNTLGVVDLDQARDRCEIFIEAFSPRLAKALAREHQINAFRWKALVPASFLTASVAARISAVVVPTPWRLIIGVVIGLIVFVPGFLASLKQSIEESNSRNIAAVVAAKGSDKAPQ
jgi:hypothetical protein